MQNTLTDKGVAETSTYSFDTAGRLVTAVIPRHTLTHGYGTASCGNAAAGKNNNRTTSSDVFDGGTPVATTYCYDNADRGDFRVSALAETLVGYWSKARAGKERIHRKGQRS